ncbi:MAG: zinc ribbon domain-containing protein [Treponema sp.]|nr:zinc ribbon domain-containing protein [Treponema sp.]
MAFKRKPRFYCDNCGYEVGSEVKQCPYCSRFFASIRCPMCSFSGPDRMFMNGCPMCGYSAPTTQGKNTKMKPPPKTYQSAEPLPFWMYIAGFGVLFALIALFSWLVMN